jgi:hypothetical protein
LTDKNKKSIGPLGAAVIGAGIGAAAAVLSDSDKREKIMSAFGEAREKGGKAIHDAKEKLNGISQQVADKGKNTTRRKTRKVSLE